MFPFIVALEGDLKRLTHLLKNGTVCADVLDSAGYSPLHYAARAGHVDIVKYLISAGAVSTNTYPSYYTGFNLFIFILFI